ncbi:chemotaxis protein CheB [Haloferula sp. BvORR071]|uniref:chemotaxis protein CheB n=1 Tax=Haloferula sp. BvORR071 TaxID=1396141 RepID=UPI000552CF49|nr:chemotaxis protein CheB [Haloferula sp. BvORR071]
MSDEPSITRGNQSAVVIGASVGAIEALTAILPALPATFLLPVLVVVHIPPDRKTILPELFASRCHLPVKEAEDKEPIRAGTIYFAPANYHLLVEPDFLLSLSNDEPVLYSRPAIDVLFESAADAYGSDLTGVILTGASADGAQGLKAIVANGGSAIVQDPATAEGTAMPTAAIESSPAARILPPDRIAAALLEACISES